MVVLSVVWWEGRDHDPGFGAETTEEIQLGVSGVSGLSEVLGEYGGAEMTLSPICQHYISAHNRVVAAGYQWEINWCKDMEDFSKCTPERFFEQYVWCVLNAGMREQVARKIYERYMEKLDSQKVGHLGKRKAIEQGLDNYFKWFGELKCAKDPIEYLQTLPWIGPITKYHLARNVGIDCVKPDRHLVKLAKHFNFKSPLDMCKAIQQSFTYERLGTIDVILWRDSNLRGVIK